jgi:error-prone DNA polymerase
MSFIHLNIHSHYSKGWGLGSVEELCLSAKGLGLDTLALTDTNGVYGLMFFLEAAREAGIRPIAGSEVVADFRRAVLLVRSRTGYANLCRILSDRNCHKDFDLAKAVREKRDGLIVISDDFSLLKSLKRDSMEDLFVEVSPGYGMHKCLAFSRESNIPPLATNRVYMTSRDQFTFHRILRAVALNTKLSRLKSEDLCREHNFLNSPRAMADQFPHAPDAIENTLKVADRCLTDWDIFGLTFPDFEGMTDKEAYDRLYRRTMEGCKRRYGEITKAVTDRVEHEMAIIRDKNFSHYFLVTADLAEKASRSCGRGSAAASIVSYALDITDVDPIKHNLFFERFLNPGRKDPPDIDIDFAWDEREQILDYVFTRHGNLRAAMVANHNTYGARSAIREVAKVYGLTEEEIGHVTDKIGFSWRLKNIRNEIKNHPKMRGVELDKQWNEILDAAVMLEAHFNHLSVHCGGVVIVPDEIRRYCPVEVSANGAQVLQWEKDSVEESGLVKIDILGNRSLAVIRDALDLVKRNYGIEIDGPAWHPIDDPKTVEIFYNGDTFGVFYFESPATRQTLTKVAIGFTLEEYLKLDHFHLNVVVTSIIRPASNQSIKTWVARLHGGPWKHIHPLLEPVLDETLGVMVFQEQLSQAAIHMAGFNASEGDVLRKVVTKKNREKKLRDFHERFIKGAKERGVAIEVIEDVWQMIMGFDGYSFCKPHSASYTMVAYKSAFMRAHYPAEFMASVISNGGGYYSTLGYLSEARRMGLRILPPDINMSEIKYTGRGRDIRVGLMQIKEVAGDALAALIYERKRNGPFASIDEFLKRTCRDLHLQDARQLIKAGCFDATGETRPALVWKALQFFDKREEKTSPSLFDNIEKSSSAIVPASSGGNYPPQVIIKNESEALGVLISVHPLDLYKDVLKGMPFTRACDLRENVGGYVTLVGWLVTGKTVLTRQGDPMKFISFEDTTGIYETVFFPKVYHRFCHMLNASRPYIIKGRVDEDSGSVNVKVGWVGFLNRSGQRSA